MIANWFASGKSHNNFPCPCTHDFLAKFTGRNDSLKCDLHRRNVKKSHYFCFGTFCEKSESHIYFLFSISDSQIKTSVGCIGACAFLYNAFANISQNAHKIKMILTAIRYYKSNVFVGGTFCEKFKTRS